METDVMYNTDALTLLKRLPDESIDLQAFDPPYGIGYKSSMEITNGGAIRKFSNAFGADVFNDSWIPDAYRVLKPGGALYMFTQWQVLGRWQTALEQAGYKIKMCIVWDKMHWGSGDLKSYGCQTELILFCTKGWHPLRWSKREGNVWVLSKLDAINNEGNYDNPAQKPESLMRRIITRSSDPGDIVLDCFAGSGSTLVAAKQLDRRYIGSDISTKQYDIACKRLSQPITKRMFT